MRLIAAAYILFAILFFSVSYPFLTQMTAAFPAEADLATALGLLSAATTAVSFVVAVFFANRLFARFGIATVALILPVVYLAGFGIWLVRFSFATAVGFRFAQQVTQRGVSNAAWSAFYNVVPGDRRAQVLAFMDGVPGQIGIALAGLLLLAAGDLLSQTATFVLGAVAAVAVAWIVIRIRRAYADSLLRTLRDGLGEQLLEGGPGLVAFDHDPKVVAALRAGLTEPNAGVRRLSADLLGRLRAPESAPDLLARLDDDDPGVRATAVRALCALGSPIPVGDVDRLAADDDPVVRAAVAEVFVQTGSPDRARVALDALINGSAPVDRVAGLDALARIRARAPDADLTSDAGVAGWVSARLHDPSADVRAAAIGALSAGDPAAPDPIPELIRALDDDDAVVRLAAARALEGRGDDARGPTLEVLQTGSERAQDAALDALDGHGDAVRPQLVAWALAQIDGAATLRRQTRALGGPPTDPEDEAAQTVAFLQSVLTGRRARIEERLVHALAILGAPDDGGDDPALPPLGRRRDPGDGPRGARQPRRSPPEPGGGRAAGGRTGRARLR